MQSKENERECAEVSPEEMKYPCIESTIEFSIKEKNIRLWINQDSVTDDYFSERIVAELWSYYVGKGKPSNQEFVEHAQSIVPNLNAIQIKEKIGNAEYGVVVYLVDFEQHG